VHSLGQAWTGRGHRGASAGHVPVHVVLELIVNATTDTFSQLSKYMMPMASPTLPRVTFNDRTKASSHTTKQSISTTKEKGDNQFNATFRPADRVFPTYVKGMTCQLAPTPCLIQKRVTHASRQWSRWKAKFTGPSLLE
jgi:hypothetical protein